MKGQAELYAQQIYPCRNAHCQKRTWTTRGRKKKQHWDVPMLFIPFNSIMHEDFSQYLMKYFKGFSLLIFHKLHNPSWCCLCHQKLVVSLRCSQYLRYINRLFVALRVFVGQNFLIRDYWKLFVTVLNSHWIKMNDLFESKWLNIFVKMLICWVSRFYKIFWGHFQ